MKKVNLLDLGLEERFKQEASFYGENLFLGRVSVQNRDIYRIITTEGESMAEVSGKFQYEAKGIEDYPAVGDWVLVDRNTDKSGNAIIHKVLRRKSSFERKLAGRCKFSDCRHENEPKCAVREAINNGDLDEERLKNFKKLQRELIYNELDLVAVEKEKIISMFGSVSAMKQSTRHIKNKKRY